MNDAERQAIRERCEAAAAGPWTVSYGKCYELPHVESTEGTVCFPTISDDGEGGEWCNSHAEFIAHARTDVPALLAEVERLRAELQKAVDEATELRWKRESENNSRKPRRDRR